MTAQIERRVIRLLIRMKTMYLKSEILEKLINDSIDGVKNGSWDNESFAIHEESGVQVKIVVTKEPGEKFDSVLPEYDDAV